jgi:hypothetical protein
VGYGYRPLRAGLWLLALLVIGTTVFGLYPPQPVDPSKSPVFSPFVYSLDLLVPMRVSGSSVRVKVRVTPS